MIFPFLDNAITINEGRLILGGFILVMIWLIKYSLKLSIENSAEDDLSKQNYKAFTTTKATLLLVLGLMLLCKTSTKPCNRPLPCTNEVI